MNKYLGISIGPLDDTMLLSRKTRELWSVSYTFSLLMQKVIEAFKSSAELVSPHYFGSIKLHGAGIYVDRSFFKLADDCDEANVLEHIESACNNFTKETSILNVKEYYQFYFRIVDNVINPIQCLNQLLDIAELSKKYSLYAVIDWKDKWNTKIHGDQYFQNLYNKAFNHSELPKVKIKYRNYHEKTNFRFPSLPEISTAELAIGNLDKYWKKLGFQVLEKTKDNLYFEKLKIYHDEDEENEDELPDHEIISSLKDEFEVEFKARHKYVSLIFFDGDNVGKLIASLEQNGFNLKEFSKQISSFIEEAVKMIVSYGGFPVFAGGDECLFFAPLANNSIDDQFSYTPSNNEIKKITGNIIGKNIFFLMEKLNQLLQTKLFKYEIEINKNVDEKDKIKISLSFGVFVGYYKHPINEMLEKCKNLLFKSAKKSTIKNLIALNIEKHSGQSFMINTRQEGIYYEILLSLMNPEYNLQEGFLNSVMYKIKDLNYLFYKVRDDRSRIENIFNNFFNETEHTKYENFFRLLSYLIYNEYNVLPKTDEEALVDYLDKIYNSIYSALRFTQFLIADDHDE